MTQTDSKDIYVAPVKTKFQFSVLVGIPSVQQHAFSGQKSRFACYTPLFGVKNEIFVV